MDNLSLEDVYLLIKKDLRLKDLFSLAMVKKDLWNYVRDKEWDTHFLPLFHERITGDDTFASVANKTWSMKQKLRYYYRNYYPDKKAFSLDFNHVKIGNICPRLERGNSRKIEHISKDKFQYHLSKITNLTLRSFNTYNKSACLGLSYVDLTHWKYFDKLDILDLYKIPRIRLLNLLIEKGYFEEDLTEDLKVVMFEKGLKMYDYCHIIYDRPLNPNDFPFRSYSEVVQLVRCFKFRTREEWVKFCKTGLKPSDIPRELSRYKEWKSWGDFLGTGYVFPSHRNYMNYEEAKRYVQSLGFKSRPQWEKFAFSKERPANIPSSPHHKYKKEWKGWGDFLGTGNVRPQYKKIN